MKTVLESNCSKLKRFQEKWSLDILYIKMEYSGGMIIGTYNWNQ